MKMLTKLLVAGTLLMSATPVVAEDAHHPTETPATVTAVPGNPAGMMGPNMMSPEMMSTMMSMMNGVGMGMTMAPMMAPEHIEGRLAFLKTELKITESQEDIWKAFAATLRESATMATQKKMAMPGTPAAPMPAKMSLLQRLDQREQMLTQQLEGLRKLQIAVKPFYNALSEDQKHSADVLIMPELMMYMM